MQINNFDKQSILSDNNIIINSNEDESLFKKPFPMKRYPMFEKENDNLEEVIKKSRRNSIIQLNKKTNVSYVQKIIPPKNVKVKVLTREEIEKREWKEITCNQQAIKKFEQEFKKVQVAKRPPGCDTFGESKEVNTRRIDQGLNWASVARSLMNQDYAFEEELIVNFKFSQEIKVPYWVVCDGHGARGREAAMLVAQEFPYILAEKLVKYNPEKLTDEGIWNAMKMSCPETDKLFEDGFSGGSTMVLSFVLGDYVYFASIGNSPALLLNGDDVIPMTRDAQVDDPSFVNSVLKRGGFIQDGLVNGEINFTRDFGNKIVVLQGKETGHKVITPRCKCTRFPLKELKKDHLILIYSDGLSTVANPQKLSQNVRGHQKTTDCEKGFAPLCEKVLRDVLLTIARKKDDCTLLIFQVN